MSSARSEWDGGQARVQRPATRANRRVRRAGAESLILHTDLCSCRSDCRGDNRNVG